MRKVRYNCAMSLDGYIADSSHEFDWIGIDPDIDFSKLSLQFDTYLMGRKTFEITRRHDQAETPGIRTFVFSHTLRQRDYDNVTIVGKNWKEVVQSLRREPGKDIWLFGGGSLFRSLAGAGLVDTVEVSVIPILLGEGIPLVADPAIQIALTLLEHRVYAKTGTVSLVYAVNASRHRTS